MKHDLINRVSINDILSIPYTSLSITKNENNKYIYRVEGCVNGNYINADVIARSENEIDKLIDYALTSGESLQSILRLGHIDFLEK